MITAVQRKIDLKVTLALVIVITLLVTGATVALAIWSGHAFRRFEHRHFRSTFDSRYRRLLQRFVTSASEKGHDYQFLRDWVTSDSHLAGARVRNEKGTIKAEYGVTPDTGERLTFERPVQLLNTCNRCHLTDADYYGSVSISFATLGKPALFDHTAPEVIGGFALFVLLLALFVSLIVKRTVSEPLDDLCTAMNAAAEGEFLRRAPEERPDEIGTLSRHFNNLLAKITDLEVNIIDTDRELVWAQQELDLKKELEEKTQIIERTNQELQKALSELAMLFDINQTINSTIELDDVLEKMSSQVADVLAIEEFAVFLVDEASARIRVSATYGLPSSVDLKQVEFGIGEGVCGQVIASKQMIYIKDVANDKRFLHFKGRHQTTGSFLCVPIQFMNQVTGALSFGRSDLDAFSSEEIQLLRSVANQAGIAIGNAQMFHKTRELSIHDELTSIYNRRFMRSRLDMEWSRSRRFDQPLSLLMMDIDNFKQLNDTYGHPFGDGVLKKIAKILLRSVRRVDTVARYGGEEFLVLLPKTAKQKAVEVAEKLRRAIERQLFATADGDKQVPVTLSIGVATFPVDATTKEQLIDLADQALYQAKSRGRNRVVG